MDEITINSRPTNQTHLDIINGVLYKGEGLVSETFSHAYRLSLIDYRPSFPELEPVCGCHQLPI